jgi:acetyl esterase/lipase
MLADEMEEAKVNLPAVEVPASVEQIKEIEYGKGGDRVLRLDLYRPRQRPAESRLPVIVYVFAGAWRAGSREQGARTLIPLAQRGFAGAAIDYRYSSEALFPAQIEDCKCAIRFLRAHADEYGLDTERIGAWGSSSGGHLSALLGTSGGVKDLEGTGGSPEQSSRIQAVVDWFGPTDFLQMGGNHDEPGSPESQLVGGPIQENQDRVARANPITYITADCPPFLIMHGADDPLVPPGQSQLLHAALQKAGVPSQLAILPGKGHQPLGDEAVARVHAFFEKHLKRG